MKPIFFLGLMVVAQFATAATAVDPQLHPQECIATMPEGKYKGLCLDLSEDRTTTRLSPEAKKKLADELGDQSILTSDYEVVDNFAYNKKFWIGIIPVNRIHEMVAQEIDILPTVDLHGHKEKNPIFISHSQIRFRLSSDQEHPVILLDRENHALKNILEEGPTKDDLVFALWAVRAEGHQETFNPLHGQTDKYDTTYALQAYDVATDWIIKGGYPTEQYLLKLNPEQSRQAFAHALDIADARETKVMYSTLFNSCSDAMFEILFKAFDVKTLNLKIGKTIQSMAPEAVMKFYRMIDKQLPSIADELKEK